MLTTSFRAVRLLGELDIPVLEQALDEVVRWHDALRTTFSVVDGEPIQVISDADSQVLAQTDVSALAEEQREGRAAGYRWSGTGAFFRPVLRSPYTYPIACAWRHGTRAAV